jgi:hypothetical protein
MELDQEDTTFIDEEELMRRLHVTSKVTIIRYREAGLPSHQITPRGRRLYVWTEVAAWVKSRCTSPAPGQDVA